MTDLPRLPPIGSTVRIPLSDGTTGVVVFATGHTAVVRYLRPDNSAAIERFHIADLDPPESEGSQ